MTVASTARRTGPFAGNGVTTAVPFTFKVFEAADIQVTHTSAAGVETVLTLGGHYTVAINADQDTSPGGTLTYPVSGDPLPVGETITIVGGTDYEQDLDISSAGRFLPTAFENALDKAVILIQQLKEKLGRALLFSVNDTGTDVTLPAAADRVGLYVAFDAAGDPVASAGTGADAGLRTDLAASTGAALAGFIESGVGAQSRTVQGRLRDLDVSVFDFLTPVQIAAVQAYTFVTDVTAACQAAMDAAHAAGRNCFFPAGGYLVTGLYIPGRVSGGTDDRGKGFRMYGQGKGEIFVVAAPKGTVIRRTTDGPVLQDYLDTNPSSAGSYHVDSMRLEALSTTDAVLLQSFSARSSISNLAVYQTGTGNGVRITYSAAATVRDVVCMNADWNTGALGAARTGVGFKYEPTWDAGLVVFEHCTGRGFLTAIELSDGGGKALSCWIRACEGSYIYNGIILNGARKPIVDGCYLEGGDGGVGINVGTANYADIMRNYVLPGFAVGIQDTSTSNIGTTISSNLVSLAATVNATCIDVASSAAYGGYNKNVRDNSIAYTLGTAGVTGIKLAGTDPRVNTLGNSFSPRGAWTGAGTLKINDTSSNGTYGITTKPIGAYEIPYLSQGALSLFTGNPVLTEANVAANVLTLPEGSYFVVTATVATTINKFAAGVTPGRLVTFRTTNANMTFADTAFNLQAGAFTGPGTITFVIDYVGATSYGYEVARTVF